MRTILVITAATACLLAAAASGEAASAKRKQDSAAPGVIKMTPGMTIASLAGRADSDIVEFTGGKRLPLRDLRRLDAVGKKLRTGGSKPVAPAFAAKPAATGMPVKDRADLTAALKRQDGETIQLPSGKRLTVGQLRLLKPEVEKRLGRTLESTPGRTIPKGPAVKLQRGADRTQWKTLLQKPDSTVLESPNGKRITVGELKEMLAVGRDRVERHPALEKGGRP